jgi:hypothetical protein
VPAQAARYFSTKAIIFYHRTISLYAELGASEQIVRDLLQTLDVCVKQLSGDGKATSILLGNEVHPAMLRRQDRLLSIQRQLQQAEEDVRADRDQSQAKQRFLDASDKIREEAGAELYKAQSVATVADNNGKQSIEGQAVAAWSIAVSLLGSGAERLEAKTKRELVSKIVALARLIIDSWTRAHHTVKFDEIKKKFGEDGGFAGTVAKSESEFDIKEARKIIEVIVDFFELVFLLQPFTTIVAHMCEEARDNVLAESIANTPVSEVVEELLRKL